MPPDRCNLLEKVCDFLSYARKQSIDAFEITAFIQSGFTATARMGDTENLEHHREMGFSVSVYHEQRSGSAAASDLSLSALRQTFDKACAIARYTGVDIYSGLADAELMADDYPDLALYHPCEVTPEKALQLALVGDQLARASDSRVTQIDEVSFSSRMFHKVYTNSHGFMGDYSATMHGQSVSVVAEESDSMERDYDYVYSRNAKDLQAMSVTAKTAVKKAVSRLGSRKIPTCRCPVIFESRVAKSLLGHFVAAISGGQIYRKTSFLVDSLGQQLFPEFITLSQQPHLLSGYGSVPFDQQGVATRPLNYVDQGFLRDYVLGSYSAKKLGMTSTGNAGGVFNLSVTHGDQDLAGLCRQIGKGLLVTELMGQGVNLMTGDYSRGAAGFWVEGGEIQYPVHEITIAGNLRDMFANVVAIGNDVNPGSNIVTGSMVLDEMVVAGSS